MSKPRRWSAVEQELLVDILIEEASKGNSSENGWKPQVWHLVTQRLHDAYPQPVQLKKEKQHVYSCWVRLKNQWKVMDALKNQSGFGWDEASQSVTADDEVWDAYLQAHPEAKQFRTTGFSLYSKLTPLVFGRVARGNNVVIVGDKSDTDINKGDQEEVDGDMDGDVDDADDDDDDDDDDEEEGRDKNKTGRTTRKRSAAHGTAATKRVRLSGAHGLFAVADAVKEVGNLVTATESGIDSSPNRHKQAIQLLEAETDFSDEEILTAIDLFARNRVLGDSYSAISRSSLRTRWLRKQLKAETDRMGMFGMASSSPLSSVPPDFSFGDLSF